MSKTDPSKAAQDNRANQLNPTHPTYHRSRGVAENEAVEQVGHSKPVQDNRATQLNPTSEAYQTSRGKGEAKGR